MKTVTLEIPLSLLTRAREIRDAAAVPDLSLHEYAVRLGECIAALNWFLEAADAAQEKKP